MDEGLVSTGNGKYMCVVSRAQAAECIRCSTVQVRRLLRAGLLREAKPREPERPWPFSTVDSRLSVDAETVAAYLGLTKEVKRMGKKRRQAADELYIARLRLGLEPVSDV